MLESNTQLIANRDSWQDAWKRRKLEDMRMLLEGAINALGKVGLMLNVHQNDLRAVLDVLPALKRPTISHLSDDEWLAVNTILDESTVRDIIPRLKEAGAQGIVEYPLNKIVMYDSPTCPDRHAQPDRPAQSRVSRRPKPWSRRSSKPCASAATKRCSNTRASSMRSIARP